MHRSSLSASRQRRLAPPCHRPTSHCCRKPAGAPRLHTAFLPCAYPARTPLCRCTCPSGHNLLRLFRCSATHFAPSALLLPPSELPVSLPLRRVLRNSISFRTTCVQPYEDS